MEILRLGLIGGSLAFLFVGWASWSAGFPVEVAAARGTVAFMGVSFIAYLGELVIATAPAATEAAHDREQRTAQSDTPQAQATQATSVADADTSAFTGESPATARPQSAQLSVVPPSAASSDAAPVPERRAA